MITGDNILTGLETAFEANIIDRKLMTCVIDF